MTETMERVYEQTAAEEPAAAVAAHQEWVARMRAQELLEEDHRRGVGFHEGFGDVHGYGSIREPARFATAEEVEVVPVVDRYRAHGEQLETD